MNERRELILKIIINEHVITGSPVGSSVLVDKYKLNMSSATVRNEMAELEEDGYITQPHTSAGRIPTVKCYRYYLKHSEDPYGTCFHKRHCRCLPGYGSKQSRKIF